MAEKEYTDEEIKELDHFLSDELNYSSYRELIGEGDKNYKDLFKPLEFVRLFNAQARLINNNAYKPFTISQNLQKLDLSNKQLYFLYEKLIEHFEIRANYYEYKPEYDIVCREISRLKEKLNPFPDKETTTLQSAKKYDFERVRRTLVFISDYYEEIAYLIKIKTEYLQETNPEQKGNVTFDRLCDFEIEKKEKIRKLMALRAAEDADDDEISEDNETVEDSNQNRNRDLTLDQTILFFSYLFEFAKVDCPNKNKAKVIATLTGFSENTINQQLSKIHKKEVDSPKAYSRDIQKVRNSFEQIKFREIISMIDKDLKFI